MDMTESEVSEPYRMKDKKAVKKVLAESKVKCEPSRHCILNILSIKD